MKNNVETIIETYKQADHDADDFLTYIDSIDHPRDFNEADFPSLVKQLENQKSEVTTKYINGASIMGGAVATTVSSSISTSMLTNNMLGGGLAYGLIGIAAIPGLNLFALPIMAIPLGIKILSSVKVKKYLRQNRAKLRYKQDRMSTCKNKLLNWLTDLQMQSENLNIQIQEEMNKKFNEYKEKTKKFTKKLAIQIDDCLNTNTNKRILQYNEVILNQYKLQKDLEEKVDFLFDEYNEMIIQKKELERQIYCLIRLLNAMGCPESVINQALNESEA